MTGRKGRGRKAAKELPVVDAGQENVIDSTTETNRNIKTVVRSSGRGRKIKNDEEIPAEQINIITAEKTAAKRGRRKMSETISIQNDDEKINGNSEIPVDKKSLKKTREVKPKTSTTVTKMPAKLADAKIPTRKSINEIKLPDAVDDDMEENKPIAVVLPFVAAKKPKGRKKADDDLVTSKKHKMNGTTEDDEVLEDDEVIPAKRGRAAKTKAKNNIKENTAATFAEDIKEKQETKKNISTKRKAAAEENKSTAMRRGKRVTASIEKDEDVEDDKEQNIIEVVEKKLKTVAAIKKSKVIDTTDTSDKTNKKPVDKKLKINATATPYDKIDFSLSKDYNLKISSWNVAGLRAWLTKGGLDYITHEKPDIVCLQELKCAEDQIPNEARIPGYHPYWLCKPGGYNGVAIYSKIMPINVEYGLGEAEQDDESRILTAEYEKFYLICVYVPNAGRKLVTLPKRLRWNDIFHKYILKLNNKKPVIICGDMNVAHDEIDLANPKTNKRNAGFTQEERDGMSTLLSYDFVDTFRHFYPNKKDAYTFWTYMANARAKNVGWRLDYFLASNKIMPKIVDNVIRSQVLGSDHCPITLFLNI